MISSGFLISVPHPLFLPGDISFSSLLFPSLPLFCSAFHSFALFATVISSLDSLFPASADRALPALPLFLISPPFFSARPDSYHPNTASVPLPSIKPYYSYSCRDYTFPALSPQKLDFPLFSCYPLLANSRKAFVTRTPQVLLRQHPY